MGRPGRGRLQEARPVRRRTHAPGRRVRRGRRAVRVAAADARYGAPGRPGAVPPPRGVRRRGAEPRAARRRHGLLVQQRRRGRDPRRGHRARVHRPRGRQGVHARGDELRVVPAARQEDHHDRARPRRGRGLERPVRALRPLARPALRRRARRRPAHLQRDRRAVRPGCRCAGGRERSHAGCRAGARRRTRLRHLQAHDRVDPRVARQRAHPRRRAGDAPGHERPRHGEHAEGRHVLRRPAHPRGEITPDGLLVIGQVARTSGSTRRSRAASASTCSARASSSSRTSGAGSSSTGSSRGTRTASPCAR